MSAKLFLTFLLVASASAQQDGSPCVDDHCIDEMAMLQTGFLQKTGEKEVFDHTSEATDKAATEAAVSEFQAGLADALNNVGEKDIEMLRGGLEKIGVTEASLTDASKMVQNIISTYQTLPSAEEIDQELHVGAGLQAAAEKLQKVQEAGTAFSKGFWTNHGDEVMFLLKKANKVVQESFRDGSVTEKLDQTVVRAEQNAEEMLDKVVRNNYKTNELDEHAIKLIEFFDDDLHELTTIVRDHIKGKKEPAAGSEMMLQLNARESSQQTLAVKAKVLQSLEGLAKFSDKMNEAAEVAVGISKQLHDQAEAMSKMKPEEAMKFAENGTIEVHATKEVQQALENPLGEVMELYTRGKEMKTNFAKNHGEEIMFIAKQLNEKIRQGFQDGSFAGMLDDGLQRADQLFGDELKGVADEAEAQNMMDTKEIASFFQNHIHDLASIVRASLAQDPNVGEEIMLQTSVDEHDQNEEKEESTRMEAKLLSDLEALESVRDTVAGWEKHLDSWGDSLDQEEKNLELEDLDHHEKKLQEDLDQEVDEENLEDEDEEEEDEEE